jgi:hypothetical protein
VNKYHHDPFGLNSVMLFILGLAMIGFVAIAVVAWSPWDGQRAGPGEGGSDPVEEEIITPVPDLPVETPVPSL